MTAFRKLSIPEVILVTPVRHADSRGFFSETWHAQNWQENGVYGTFVQDNHSMSVPAFTVRALHFQREPFAQGKLVRVSRGKILDVAVDIRANSPTFGQHEAVELDAKTGQQLWVPPGFAHGFCTLEANTEVQYKVTAPYEQASEGGLRWNDPALGINWQIPAGAAPTINERDQEHPLLAELPPLFQVEKS